MKDACFYDRMSGFMNFKGAHLYFLFLNYMGYSQIWQKIIVWGIMMPFKILWDITIFIIFHLSASGAWFIYGCNLEIKVLPLWQQRYTFASRGSCSLPLAKITNVLISVSDTAGRRQHWGQPGVILAHVSREGRAWILGMSGDFNLQQHPWQRAERVLHLLGFKWGHC